MDNPPLQEEGYANVGRNIPATAANSLTTDDDDYLEKLQRADEDAKYLMSKESNENASIFTSDGTAHTNQTMSASLSRDESTSRSKNLQGYSLSSSLESEWNIGHYQGPQVGNALVNEALYNNEYQYNIGQLQGSQMDNAPVNTEFFNNVCQMNIVQYQGSQKDDTTVKSADAIESVGGGVHSGELILAVSGPSGLHGNQNEPKVLDEKLNSNKPLKILSVVPRRIITCLYCGEGIDKHTKILKGKSGKKTYCCCVCKYTTKKTPNTLQKHIRIHCSKKDCGVCSKYYTEGTLHVSQQTCQLCSVTFDCRTRLHEHLLELHLEYFSENCWECFQPVSAHHTKKEGKKLFFCCMCGYETDRCSNIQGHNVVHRPKNFCKICKEEYKEKRKGFHNINYLCIVCKEEFECKIQLEDHYKDFSCSKYFDGHCWLCDEIINKHYIDREEKQYYKCCACEYQNEFKCRLTIHIHSHTGLRFFKCDTCDKRYTMKGNLDKHLKKCIPLPSLCEICKAKFPSDDSLNEHCLEKHRQTT